MRLGGVAYREASWQLPSLTLLLKAIDAPEDQQAALLQDVVERRSNQQHGWRCNDPNEALMHWAAI